MEEATLHDMLARPTPTLSHMREGGSRPPRGTFVNLPQHVRDQIYQEAGYGGNKFIDLNLWTMSRLNKRWRDKNVSFSAALLSVGSHLIHDEVETKLYAENTFAVSLTGEPGLQPLERLSDAALRELRTLIVSICPCACQSWTKPQTHDEAFLNGRRQGLQSFWQSVDDLLSPTNLHSRPLNSVSRTDISILAQWKRICTRLAVNLRPHQLSLFLVANVDGVETAKGILDPLSGMPPLRDVAINLGHCLKGIKDFDPKSFIRKAAWGLLGEKIKTPPFRFMNLPLELQIQILQQTSLVAGENVHFWRNQALRLGNFQAFHSGNLQAFCSSDFGKTCSVKLFKATNDKNGLSQPLASATIFCCREYPDAFSQHCECDSFPPVAYFNVSKDFPFIARHVYYSSNKLCFHPATDRGNRLRLTLPQFLRHIPLESLWSLRNLCVIFPTYSPDYKLPNQADWHAWVESIQRLSHLADLSRLKLEVHFSSDCAPLVNGMFPFFYRGGQNDVISYHSRGWKPRDESMEKAMFNSYKRMLEPLKELSYKLLSLQVYFPWGRNKSVQEERRKYEQSLEQMVMGDKYNSAKWGKRDASEFF